ncbi:MAG: hypothetical protein WCG34_06935 [Leptolinea sp.]
MLSVALPLFEFLVTLNTSLGALLFEISENKVRLRKHLANW